MESINLKILELMWVSIKSEGGDGDAIWLTKFTSLSDLKVLIEDFNEMMGTGWEIKQESNHLVWGDNQEWAFITDDRYFYQNQPDWINLKIDY